MDGGWFFFDRAALRGLADRHRSAYAGGRPFPHVAIDDFLPPEVFARLAAGFPASDHPGWKRKDHAEQAARLGGLQRSGFAGVDPFVRHLLNEVNGMALLDFLERLTGVTGLVPDPHFLGGGLHLTLPGGHLDLHADFGRDRRRGLARRLTLLLYAESAWEPSWGGDLELWDAGVARCEARLPPLPNRLVVLAHGEDHWHGHPEPLRCPPDRARKVLAAYYYVAPGRDEGGDAGRGATWVRPAAS